MKYAILSMLDVARVVFFDLARKLTPVLQHDSIWEGSFGFFALSV
jgi:hypothetical protein